MREEELVTPLVHDVSTAARLLDTTYPKIRELIESGVLKAVRICGVLKVPHSELLRLIESGDGSTTLRGQHAKRKTSPADGAEQSNRKQDIASEGA